MPNSYNFQAHIEGKILGPIHHADLSSNILIRRFLMKFSSPMRYLFGLVAGLFLGSLYHEYLIEYWAVLLITAVLALVWVLLSLFARTVVKDALIPMLDENESLADYQLMFSQSWIAAVKSKGGKHV